MIYSEMVMARANEEYKRLCLTQGRVPKDTSSAQIRALCEALTEAFNEELVELKERVRFLEPD